MNKQTQVTVIKSTLEIAETQVDTFRSETLGTLNGDELAALYDLENELSKTKDSCDDLIEAIRRRRESAS
jgi:hypothetical protein